MTSACVLLADGFEEVEAMSIIDVLRRAGVNVKVAGVTGPEAKGAHDVTVRSDIPIAEAKDTSWDAVVLPGGMPGSANLRDSADAQALIKKQYDAGRKVAAICAAPIALSKAGILKTHKATCYPGFEDQVDCAGMQKDRVVVDGNITTSRGPGTALEFSLSLAEQLAGREKADQLRSGMLIG